MENSELLSRILKFIANYPDLFLSYGLGLFIVFLLFLFLVLSLVTYLSAFIAEVEKRNLSLSFLITFLNNFVLLVSSLLFSIVPIFGTIIGFFFGLFMNYGVIKIFLKTSYRKALIVLVFYWFWKFIFLLTIAFYFFFKKIFPLFFP